MRTLKRLIYFVFIIAIFFSGWLYLHVHSSIHLPEVPYEFSIAPGNNLKQVSQQLANDGVLISPWPLVLLSRYVGNESSIKAGDYTLTENISQVALLDYLVKGDVKQVDIKFLEGWTFAQIRAVLSQHPGIANDTDGLSESEVLQLIGAKETAAEGLFFPDTYYVVTGGSDVDVLKRAYQTMQTHLQTAWETRQESLPLKTPYDALILASIVEKETGLDRDRAEIAGVFTNRLRIGMRLQTDPTVIYGLGERFDGNLRKKDLQTDQAYNTYTRSGLPPTPIAMPGLSSIRAALNPAETKAIYFVAKGNGESHFSTNLADHNRAVNKYQRRQK